MKRLPEPFLRQVADAFVEHESDRLIDICFVTPNKRSGVFLARRFAEELTARGETALLPRITSISDFIYDLSDTFEASRIELLLMLYGVYRDVMAKHGGRDEAATVDFNRFLFWGDILLNDFNDVDRYMVDHKQIFKNIHDLKEISANFLTPEQIEVIKRYWNEELVPEPVKEFWRHSVHTHGKDKQKGKNVAGFVKLWQVMGEIYEEFRRRLLAKGMSYPGMTYRSVVERIKGMDADDFDCKKYVFVGFNVLSKSEREIFEALKAKGIADFYWDYASPMFRVRGNRAVRFLAEYVDAFPSAYKGIGGDEIDYYPDVEVVSVPSTFGQAKLIGNALKRLYPDGLPADMIDTAIVLPDENLAQPLLNALPADVAKVNVTMGFALRNTNIASLLRNVVSLQLRARSVRQKPTFFYDDVITVLTHPLIRRFFWRVCDEIVSSINAKRMFNIGADFFDAPEYQALKPIFSVVRDSKNPDEVIDYFAELLDWLMGLIGRSAAEEKAIRDNGAEAKAAGGNDAGETSDGAQSVEVLESLYLHGYQDAVAELRRVKDIYLRDVYLEDKTIFHMVERIVGIQTRNYSGEPLEGLQVMGVLETRCLDFSNVIMTSMNERVFPRRHYAKSFIPEALRKGYRMATIEHQESIYAYYFYRLISRADKVILFYDGRTSGLRSGGPTRYINQIRYQFPPGHLTFSAAQFTLKAPEQPRIAIKKTPQIMAELEKFRQEGGRHFSASSINQYIECPLSFYLAHIEKYYPEDELKDFMDESTYGLIVHEAAERIYTDARGADGDEVELTNGFYNRVSNRELIGRYIEREIKKLYLKVPEDDPAPLVGDAAIYKSIMTRTLMKMFDREREFGEQVFFVEGERPQAVALRLSDEMTANFTFRIDRVDRVVDAQGGSRIRLIDYKTGEDPISAKDVNTLFNSNHSRRPKAMLQLMLYSNCYARGNGYDGPIEPYIYQLRHVAVRPLSPLKLGSRPVTDYREHNEEFLERLDALLKEIFNPSIDFVAKPSQHSCRFCKFKEICQVSDE